VNGSLITASPYTDSPALSGSIPAGKNVYVRYYVTTGDNAGGSSLPSNEVSLFVGKTVSGTIASNTTWSENKIVVGDVTVNSGAAVTVAPGTTIRFANGINYISYGNLNAVGTTAQPITFTSLTNTGPGCWGSIILNGSGSISSNIDYTTIQYGTEILILNTWSVPISHCIIEQQITGLRVSDADITITDSKIVNPRDYGIVADNSFVNCYRDEITSSYSSEYGILWSNFSAGDLYRTKITGFGSGVSTWWYSSPNFWDSNTSNDPSHYGQNNYIGSCGCGVTAYEDSYPAIGYSPDWDPSGITSGNNIYNNQVAVGVIDCSNDYIYAERVYWGITDATALGNYLVGGGAIMNPELFDYSNPLSVSTWPSVQSSISSSVQSSLQKLSLSVRNSGSSGTTTTPLNIVNKGLQLRLKKDYAGARECFQEAIADYPQRVRPYLELYRLQHDTLFADAETMFTGLSKNVPPVAKFLQAHQYVKKGKPEQAKQIHNEVIKQYPNSKLSVHAKLNNFYIALYTENNPREAERILQEVQSNPKLSTPEEITLAQHALEYYVKPVR
jgi:TolA-binding protein